MTLSDLIAAHNAAMKRWDDCPDDKWDDLKGEIGSAIDAARDALLEHRCTTIDEVRRKADFMAGQKSFVVWDDVEPLALIYALRPRDPEPTVMSLLRAGGLAS